MTIAFKHCYRSYRATLALPLAIIMGLLGCSTALPSRPATDQFLVEPVRFSHQVTFASDTAEMALAAPEELAMFLSEVDPDGKADIYLDAGGSLRDRRLDAVQELLRHLGRAPFGAGGASATDYAVTVTVTDDILLPTSCMDHDQWPDPNLPPSNCTTGLTLVRMVEDPDDVLRGRKLGPASAAVAAQKASDHMLKTRPAEVPASAEGQQQQQLPPSTLTRDASY